MSGVRRNSSMSGQQYGAYQFGNSNGYVVRNSRQRMTSSSMNNMTHGSPFGCYQMPGKSASLNNASVRGPMQRQGSFNPPMRQQYQMQRKQETGYYPRNNMTLPNANLSPYGSAGDAQFLSGPPKVYMNVPGVGAKDEPLQQQNIPCQFVPPGTDPMSVIKPLAPVTVRVQAPADLFASNPDQPKTISISPTQLYGQIFGGGK